MMKDYPVALVVVIGAIALSQSAYANEYNVQNITSKPNQAAALITEPATITSKWGNVNGQSNPSKPGTETISAVQDRKCQNINPLDFINNPEAFFTQCQKQTDNQSPQRNEPIEYLKVPRLDSGISVTVTKF